MQYWADNKNKILITTAVVAAILVLFFLPELLTWKYSIDVAPSYLDPIPSGSTDRNYRQSQQVGELASDVDGMSPLDQVAYLLDSGFIESERSRRKALMLRGKFESGLVEPSWSQLKSSEAAAELRRLREQSLLLLGKLSESDQAARRALSDFVGAISFVSADASQVLTAREALDHLHSFYLEVTRALAAASIDRSLFLAWSDVELGDLFNIVISEAELARLRPFDPQIIITNVRVFLPDDGRGQPNRSRSPGIWLRGQLRGEDISSFVLERDNFDIIRLGLQPVRGRPGLWSFEYSSREARGLFIFRAYDRDENVSFKTYRFYPKASKFPWREGRFMIQLADGDPRFDRIFLVARTPQSRQAGFFDRRGLVRF